MSTSYLAPALLNAAGDIFKEVWTEVSITLPASQHGAARDLIAVWIVSLAEHGERDPGVLRDAGYAAATALGFSRIRRQPAPDSTG
ncbi:hypothetical protein BH10PSE7_BH10PSE7_41570 [soil metagenome]